MKIVKGLWFTVPLCLLLVGRLLAAHPDDLRFSPPVLDVVRDSTGYVQAMIYCNSVSGDSVTITNVSGSCRCAAATVQRATATDSVQGKIYLAINAKHFTDSLNYLDYTITHTGNNSPSMYRVIVRLPHKTP